MPAPLNAPHALKIQVLGHWNGTPWANIFHAQWAGVAPSGTDCNNIAAAFQSAYTSAFNPLLVNTMQVEETLVTDLDTSTGASGSHTATVPGGLAVFTGPNQVAPVIAWHTPFRYRGGHPRTFLPGIPDSVIVGGRTLQGAFQTNLGAAIPTFLSNVAAIMYGINLIVGLAAVHYHRGHAVLNPPLVEVISSGSVRSLVSSQRGRRT